MATPTGVTVTNLGDYWPTFNAVRTADTGKVFSMEWQISSDAGFATVLYTISDTAQGSTAVTVSKQFSDASRSVVIPAGTYYVRARQLENGVTPGSWSTTATITSTVAPPTFSVPNIASPAGTVGSNTPNLSVEFLGDQTMSNYQRKLIPQIELAAAADFTGTTYIFDVGATLKYAPNPVRVGFNGVASTIPSGTYHVRMRARDEIGAYSSYYTGADATLVVSATASNLSPNSVTLPYVTAMQLSWTYNDLVSGSDQTAFKVVVYRSDTSAVVYDSGKVTSSVKSATFAPAVGLKEIPLYWTAQVWNTQDYVGAISSAASFTLTEPAVLDFTSPSGSTVTTGRPTFNWTVGGVNPLRSWILEVRRQTDNVLIWTASGGIGTFPVTPVYNILVNGVTYVANLSVTSTSGEVTTDTKTFTASFTPPSQPLYTLDDTGYDLLGYIEVDWSNAVPDSSFAEWNVYRREHNTTEWERIYKTANESIRVYHDWDARVGITYEYVVTQTALVVGDLQESALSFTATLVTPATGGYWLIDSSDEDNNVRLTVKSDSFSNEIEQAILHILGRGRTVEYGDVLGLTGDLTISIRPTAVLTAKQTYDKIRDLREQMTDIKLRDPFGNITPVAIGEFQWSHVAGTGQTEMYDATIHLDEVH